MAEYAFWVLKSSNSKQICYNQRTGNVSPNDSDFQAILCSLIELNFIFVYSTTALAQLIILSVQNLTFRNLHKTLISLTLTNVVNKINILHISTWEYNVQTHKILRS